MDTLNKQLDEDMKNAMRAKDSGRLAVLRFIKAAIKQYEVDNRKAADDEQVITILTKLSKRHLDSIEQFKKADRQDLVDKEETELAIVQEYLPAQLSDAEIEQMINEAIQTSQASAMQDMGKVMQILKAKLQGRADMSKVSAQVRQLLS